MALFIRDDEVDALASLLQKTTGAETKKDAVRAALKHELDRVQQELPLREKLSVAMGIADAMGPSHPDFDFKQFSDEMWEP